MTDFDALQNRLRNLASAPVDDDVAGRHLESLAFAAPAAVPMRSRTRMVVAGAVVAGSLLGSATLAGAVTGNLPDRAQDVAHEALAKVGVDVPKGQAKKADKAEAADTEGAEDGEKGVERFLEGCTNPDGSAFTGNHGQYVKAHPDDEATADVDEREEAARSRCGKPIQAGTDEGTGDEPKTTEDHGKPEAPGRSEEHKPADAGKPEDTGKPDDAGTGKPQGAGKPDGAGKTTD
jgi:hypothetical protein